MFLFSLTNYTSGANVSHIVVVKPIRAGTVNFTYAELKYLSGTEGAEKQVCN